MPLASRDRFSFANLDEVLPLPDLIAIQRDSFAWFLDRGLAETFRERVLRTEDSKEGPRAFVEKRAPDWKCR